MNNSNSFFSVKNAGLFLLLISLFFSFTNPNEKRKPIPVTEKASPSFFNDNLISASLTGGTKVYPSKGRSAQEEMLALGRMLPVPREETDLAYPSNDQHEGLIGSGSVTNSSDNPSDNIYNVNLLQYDRSKQYTLVYSVYGVSSTSSVTRSINRSFSLGGYIKTEGNSWITVKEDISPDLLHQGNNQILFNAAQLKDFYRIKEVRIVESHKKNRDAFYTVTGKVAADNRIYLRGYVNRNAGIKSIMISGKEISFNNNEFEYFDFYPSAKNDIKIKFIKEDGSFTEERISKFESGGSATDLFTKPEENVLFKDRFGFLSGLRNIDLPPVEASITNVSKDFTGYRYKALAEGKKTLHLPYDRNKIPKGFREHEISTFRFDYQQKKWQRTLIDSINTEQQYVILTVENGGGDTDYVNGIIKNPESPETSSFTPTTTNDIPVANPVSKINMIAPPVANQQGSANVSYPIEIPAGINGFQPNISLTYNSDMKNGGWLGVGWDIPLETVEIDTRWGVPVFDNNKESEIYTINGEQLVFDDQCLPNKIPCVGTRGTADKQFYFRTGVKEGTKIIRKGSSPGTYTWEITSDDGTVKRYTETLKDNSGNNVVKWFLKSITDAHGNEIVYEYEPVPLNGYKNRYLKKIVYSKNQTIIEFASTSFVVDGNRIMNRHDVTSSYKLGVKISEFKLLDNIIIHRAGAKIREYQLEYKTGEFEKTLLSRIIQKNGNNVEFNRHNFNYSKVGSHDSSEWDGENLDTLFSENTQTVYSQTDHLNNGVFPGSDMTLISGNEGKSQNWRGALTIGFSKSALSWFLPISVEFSKNGTIGFNYSYTENESFGKSQLMDMDGDGLPDKVFYKNGGSIQYRKNVGDGFSTGAPITVEGFSGRPLSRNNSYTNTYGLEYSWKNRASGGINFSTTKSNSPVYFSDVNGDGLVDLVYYGKVYFNKLRESKNQISNIFAAVEADNQALNDTPNTILKGIDAPRTTEPEEESSLLSNIVRAWEAPETGIINIVNLINLEQNSAAGQGIEFWMEKGALQRSNELGTIPVSNEIPNSRLVLNTTNPYNQNLQGIQVAKGQRIYMIASVKEKSAGDKIKLNTAIEYVGLPNVKDANGDYFFKFNAKESFLESSLKGNAVSGKGKAKISWPALPNELFSDAVSFKIYKLEQKASDPGTVPLVPKLIFHQKLQLGQSLSELAPDENLIAGINIEDFAVNTNSTDADPTITYLYLDVSSDTNVAWSKINWLPKIQVEVQDEETQVYNAVVQYRTFSEKIKIQSFPPAENLSVMVNQRRYYPAFGECYNDIMIPVAASDGAEVTFSMKFINYYDNEKGKLYPIYTKKKKVKVKNGWMEIPYIDYYGSATYTRLFYEIHTDNYEVGTYLANLNPYINIVENNCFVSSLGEKPNYYSTRSNTKHYNMLLGQMWQGWGGFSYNGSYNNTVNQPLSEENFNSASLSSEDDNYIAEPPCSPTAVDYEDCLLNFVNGQKNKRYFTPLEVDAESHVYTSPMESAHLDREYLQPYHLLAHKSSQTFEGAPKVETANPLAIITHSKGWSLNIYGGFSIPMSPASVGGNGGYSRDETSEFFQDFNGDSYPDIIVGDQYYKTDFTGALTAPEKLLSDKTITNRTYNGGLSGGYSNAINSTKMSNTAQGGFNSFGEMFSHSGTSANAAGVSANMAVGLSWSGNNNIWLDINGDGLMDYINSGKVYINTGKSFEEEANWDIGSDVFKNETVVVSGGGGVSIGGGSWVMGVGKNLSSSVTKVIFIDMNGDGLLDKLKKDNGHLYLYINTGTNISSQAIDLGEIDAGKNNQNSSGLNVFGTICPVIFKIKVCVSLGGNKDQSTNRQTADLRDFNGDGLPDVLVSFNDTQMTVIPNQSDKFNLLSSIENPMGGYMALSYSHTDPLTHKKIGNTYQMPFTKQALVKVEIDDVESTVNLAVYNKENRPRLLKHYYFGYENGVQDRRERSFLGFGKVTTKDMTGITQVTEYETNYKNAYNDNTSYDNSSDFYVPYDDASVRRYFYKKGLVKSTYTLDSIGRQRQRVNYTYRYFNQQADSYALNDLQQEPKFGDIGRIIPFLYQTESITTEYSGAASHSKTLLSTVNEYDRYGNVTTFTDLGSTPNDPSDDLRVAIMYHPVTANNVGGIPQLHTVSDASGNILRKSETEINSKGEIVKIKRFMDSDFAEYKYEYDLYGNITKATFPKNSGETEADRMFYQYEYDPVYNTYITGVTDARGLSSSTTYDYLFGVPDSVTDINGQTARYEYDSFGRPTEYLAPSDTGWTIKLYYSKTGDYNSKTAVTEKKAPVVNGVVPSLNYFSSVQTNGWGEELAVKKLYGGTANNYIYTYGKSPLKDLKGRVIKSFANRLATRESSSVMVAMNNFSPQSNQMLNEDEFKNNFVTYHYDELDRTIKTTQKGVVTNEGIKDLITQTVYGFDSDRNGIDQFTKKTVSPKGITSVSFTDAKGRTTATKQVGDQKTLWTSYSYDLLNQLTEVKDQNSNSIVYGYDQLGRRISQTHPDAGTSTYEYDLNNNLIYSDNQVLHDLNQKISYTYKFNRLTGIRYPQYQVTYEYGDSYAADFGAGRLIKMTDHTGIQMYRYSAQGQIIENKRVMVAPNVAPKVFKTNFVYDTYNRINKITYPDSEEVFYNYTPFGLLDNIESKAAGSPDLEPIITNILYDYNEQTREITAGNGTKTQYSYDVWGRLQELALVGTTSDIRKNRYLFDKDANISSINTTVPMHGTDVVNDISVATEKTFQYDGFNRLQNSVIKAIGKEEKKYYQLEMGYTDMHGIANKNSRWKTYQTAALCENPAAEGYKAVYQYEDRNHPNAVSSVEFHSPNESAAFTTPWDCRTGYNIVIYPTSENYTYDANGNMTKVELRHGTPGEIILEDSGMANQRQLFWDAQNRLQGISEDRALHHYVYDEEGQRALKSEGASRMLYKDGNLNTRPGPTVMGDYTYYPNGYVVANDRQVSKHYYIGSNKVAARVAETPGHLFMSPENHDLQNLSGILQQEVEDMALLAGLPRIEWANPLPDIGSVRESEENCSMEILVQADQFMRSRNKICYEKIMKGYETAMLNGTVCAFWHQFKLDDCMTDLQPEEQRYQTYWVHPDHLGSGSVITNQSGETTNWYEYMPFGEMLMEQSNNEYNNPFKYNGKELDEATGLYYYGARYYDPRTSIWLSVDPLAEKMPSWSPYVYSFNNPVKYTDPDGRMPMPPDDHFDVNGNFIYRDNKTTNNVIVHGVTWSAKLSELDYSKWGTRKAVSNIIAHYAKQKGYYGRYGVDNYKEGATAYYSSKGNSVYFAGKVLSAKKGNLDNYYDIRSTLDHEAGPKGHKYENIPALDYKFSDHADIYYSQATSSDYSRASSGMQYTVAFGYAEHLWNAYDNAEISPETVNSRIDSFNKNNSGGVTITPEWLSGSNKLNVQINNYEPKKAERLSKPQD